MAAADEFVEYANVFGHYCGTARRFLAQAKVQGHDLLLDIDVQGASQLKERVPDTVSIFVLPPVREELEWRPQSRGLDAEDVIQRRLAIANDKMENYRNYDYVLVNKRFEGCGEQLRKIVLSERERRSG